MGHAIDIVIRSYHRDVSWLSLVLRSIELFVTGHRRVIVVAPRSSHPRMNPPALDGASLLECPDYRNDYLGQQVTKLHADQYTDADIILHVDSDQIFVAACDLSQRLFHRDRLRMTYDPTGRRPARDGWRRCVEGFFGRPVEWDLATSLPLAVPRHVYAALRGECLSKHQVSITQYAHAARVDHFSETALLRGYVALHEHHRYEWVDASKDALVPECRTFWSRAETTTDVMHVLPAALTSP